MTLHDLRVATRALQRHPSYALLNGVGLAVALACCLLVGLFVRSERSVDRHHPPGEDLLIATGTLTWSGEAQQRTSVPHPLAAALAGHEAVASATVVAPPSETKLRRDGWDQPRRAAVAFATGDFFDTFGWPVVRGSADALRRPGVVFLTERAAARLFEGDPVGQTLSVDRYSGPVDVTVAGILADPAGPTTLDIEALVSFESLAPDARRADDWDNWNRRVFVRLAEGRTAADLQPALDAIASARYDQDVYPRTFSSVPLAELYLSDLHSADGFRGAPAYLRLFSLAALLVLLLGVVNYVNLATARATRRAPEVGVRKAIGAGRRSLAGQFLGEAAVLAGLAGLAAVGLTALALPGFNALFGTELALGDLDLAFAFAALGLVLATGLLSGVYPALVLSGFSPAHVLRGLASTAGRPAKGRLRQGLVVAQFAVALLLVVGTAAVLRQIAFAAEQGAGFDEGGLVAVDLRDGGLNERYAAFLNEARRSPAVTEAVVTEAYPSQASNTYWVTPDPAQPGVEVSVRVFEAEPGYVQVVGAPLAAGRDLDPAREADRLEAVVINEAAVRELGWGSAEAALGKTFAINGIAPRVVGVVADHHVGSFREEIPAVAIFAGRHYRDDAEGPVDYGYALFRLAPDGLAPGLAALRRAWEGQGPDAPFDPLFVDESVAGLYEAERRLGGVLSAFSAVALLVACLGLIGLASFTAERRRKEIGVRRVLGATVRQVVVLLTREYAVLMAIGAAVAVPVALVAVGRWLDGFAYPVALGPGTFALAIGGALGVALLAVGVQAVRAAASDPVRALRSE